MKLNSGFEQLIQKRGIYLTGVKEVSRIKMTERAKRNLKTTVWKVDVLKNALILELAVNKNKMMRISTCL